jgi:hypothetical protein
MKGKTMSDCKCINSNVNLSDPQTDLLLQSGVIDELSGRIQYFLDRHVNGLMGAGPLLSFGASIWLPHLYADRAVILAVTASGFLTIPVALYRVTIAMHKPARPGYIMAALRSAASEYRRLLLDELNTVSLRGQRIPLTRADVLFTAKVVGAAESSTRSTAKEARKQQAARVQASLIDAFRQG